jgi:hypothetical protein
MGTVLCKARYFPVRPCLAVWHTDTDTGVHQLTNLTRYGGLTPTIPDMLDSSTYLPRLEPDAGSTYHASDDSMTWTSQSGIEGESVVVARL